MEGAGVRLRRFFSNHEVALFDPFLLLDDFSGTKPDDYLKGFPWHPHRGIETITYVLDGMVDHGDSLGNKGTIGGGDIQWMTAGSGIIHQEMPRGSKDGTLSGFQLWTNLPASKKMTTPQYRDIREKEIPVVHGPGGSIYRIIAGEMEGVRGPVRDVAIQPSYFDISMPSGCEFAFPTPFDDTFFAFVISGEANFGAPEESAPSQKIESKEPGRPPVIPHGTVVLYSKGSVLSVATADKPVRFLLIGGKPLNEPVAWYGPIVMNTEKELRIAFEEFQVGTFIKHAR
jgi:redox-sensitive bicupin YhaK (pirin superfamily)